MKTDPIVFLPALQTRLPQTYSILSAANLTLHPRVARVVLHGSRGLRGSVRPDSDIDLSLLVETADIGEREEVERVLRAVLDTTLCHWQGTIEADLAAVFDIKGCGLPCFDSEEYQPGLCEDGGVDCFGLYKIQKGFSGFAPKIGVSVRQMYPCLVIWRSSG